MRNGATTEQGVGNWLVESNPPVTERLKNTRAREEVYGRMDHLDELVQLVPDLGKLL